MGGRPKSRPWAIAALLLGLSGILHAQSGDRTYTLHLPSAVQRSQVEIDVPRAGDWEVTVDLNLAACEIYCTYRLKRDPWGQTRMVSLLLPPVTTIRVYNGPGDPSTLTVDPAGLRHPAAAGKSSLRRDAPCLPGTRPLPGDPPRSARLSPPAAPRVASAAPVLNPSAALPCPVPLRV